MSALIALLLGLSSLLSPTMSASIALLLGLSDIFCDCSSTVFCWFDVFSRLLMLSMLPKTRRELRATADVLVLIIAVTQDDEFLDWLDPSLGRKSRSRNNRK